MISLTGHSYKQDTDNGLPQAGFPSGNKNRYAPALFSGMARATFEAFRLSEELSTNGTRKLLLRFKVEAKRNNWLISRDEVDENYSFSVFLPIWLSLDRYYSKDRTKELRINHFGESSWKAADAPYQRDFGERQARRGEPELCSFIREIAHIPFGTYYSQKEKTRVRTDYPSDECTIDLLGWDDIVEKGLLGELKRIEQLPDKQLWIMIYLRDADKESAKMVASPQTVRAGSSADSLVRRFMSSWPLYLSDTRDIYYPKNEEGYPLFISLLENSGTTQRPFYHTKNNVLEKQDNSYSPSNDSFFPEDDDAEQEKEGQPRVADDVLPF